MEKTVGSYPENLSLLQKQRGILQHMIDCTRNMHLVYLDRNFNFVCVNQAYAETCGYTSEEMIGKNHFALYPHKENEEIFRRVRDTGLPERFHDKPFVFPDQPKRGVTYWDWTLQPIKNKKGDVEGLVLSLVETTERKLSEVRLYETKLLLDSIVNSTRDMIWSVGVDKDFRLLTFNKALSDFFLETQNLHIKPGMPLKELLPTEQLRRRWRALNKKALKEDSFTTEYVTHNESRILELTFNVLKSEDSPFAIAVFGKDITERKKAQKQIEAYNKNLERLVEERTKQLSVERARLFNVLEGLHVMVCLLTADRHVTFANRAFREKFGECDGKYCYEYFGKKMPCDFCESYKVLETGKKHQWIIQSTDELVIQAYDYPFTDVDGTKMVLEVAMDITEQIKMQRQLKDSERLAAIGATAGMVGHDIRNPLQAIVGELYLSRITTAMMPEGEIKAAALSSLDFIDAQVEYINKIVVDLQDYARPIVPVKKETDVKALFADVLVNKAVPVNIKVASKVAVTNQNPLVDSGLLKRILTNLVNNAVQAMPDGGKLVLRAFKQADDLVVTVEDTGAGIPAEVQSKMFTPLFTTKSKGQGFGLAVVKRMTEAMGGTVSFETQPAKGTKFTVRLPFT